MLGDSITHFWAANPIRPSHRVGAWNRLFAGRRVVNLGTMDRTENVLWRLTHGEFEASRQGRGRDIGTNNVGRNTDEIPRASSHLRHDPRPIASTRILCWPSSRAATARSRRDTVDEINRRIAALDGRTASPISTSAACSSLDGTIARTSWATSCTRPPGLRDVGGGHEADAGTLARASLAPARD